MKVTILVPLFMAFTVFFGFSASLEASSNVPDSQTTPFNSSTSTSESLELNSKHKPHFPEGAGSISIAFRSVDPTKPLTNQSLTDKAHALVGKAVESVLFRGNYEAAIRYYEEALKEMPNDRGILIALSHTKYQREKQLGLIKPKPNPKAAILLDALEYGKGDWKTSIRYLEDAMFDEQDKGRLMATRDAFLEIKGIYGDVQFEQEAMEMLYGYKREDATVRLIRNAFNDLDKGYFDEAMENFKGALKLNPGDTRIREMIAYVGGLQFNRFESLNTWAENQRGINGKLRNEALQRKEEAMHALAQSQEALNLSRELDDAEATSISQQAIDIAKQALNRANAMLAGADARLAAVKKAYNSVSKGAAGVANRLKGELRIKTSQGWETFDVNEPLKPGDELRTGKESSAELLLTDGSTLNMDANTSIKLGQSHRKKSFYERIQGRIRTEIACVRKFGLPCKRVCYRINTRLACVRGTELEITTPPGGPAVITVMDGVLEIGDQKEGEQIKVGKGKLVVITTEGEVKKPAALKLDSIKRWWEEAF